MKEKIKRWIESKHDSMMRYVHLHHPHVKKHIDYIKSANSNCGVPVEHEIDLDPWSRGYLAAYDDIYEEMISNGHMKEAQLINIWRIKVDKKLRHI